MSDRYEHMQETWGIDRNPFPAEAISQGDEPYSPDVFPEELEKFFSRMIYGAAMDRRGFGFLWSKGVNNEDTGMGKTTILRQASKEVNRDFGETVLTEAGMKPERVGRHKGVAAYASFNTMSVNGVYPVLFAAVEYLADPRNGVGGSSVLDALRTQIREEHEIEEDDADGLRNLILAERRKLGATLAPLRADTLDAFCTGEDGDFASFLSGVSQASRIRNGLAYFDFAFTIISAAGVRHLFLFIDQLEDLATTPTVAKAKRTREVGRMRDIIAETQPFVGRVHCVFTFHARAAEALDEMWRQTRLPSYDPEDPANENAVVVLRGIQTVEQVRTLLVTYLDKERIDGETGELAPFEESALPVLLQRSGGRPGILLMEAHKLFDKAADLERPAIDGALAADVLGLSGAIPATTFRRSVSADSGDARAVDELLR
jgi:hypothetical protein